MRITAKKDSNLLNLLVDFFQGTSTTKLKKMIMYGCISYNGAVVKSLEMIIKKGEFVEYKKYTGGAKIAKQKTDLPVIYEDRNLIVINKSCGVKFISNVSYKGQTICSIVKSYLKRKYNNQETVFPICRVEDAESGLCVLARDKRSADFLSKNWHTTEKRYLAIMQNDLSQTSAKFNNHPLQSIVGKDGEEIPRTISLQYKKIEELCLYNEKLHLLEVIQTEGSVSDCRDFFAEIGNPIIADLGKSDLKYRNNFMKLCLTELKLRNPETKQNINLAIEPPRGFKTINL